MEAAILVIWWIGLIGALVVTLIILKEVALVLKALKDIHYLAVRTETAARGIADHVAVGGRLGHLSEPIAGLQDAVKIIAVSAASIRHKLGGRT